MKSFIISMSIIVLGGLAVGVWSEYHQLSPELSYLLGFMVATCSWVWRIK